MTREPRPKRRLLLALVLLSLPPLMLGALGAWSIAPHPGPPVAKVRAAVHIAKAPFAERIVVGDSRIESAQPTDAALWVGYGSATFRDLERLAGVICSVSDAPVVVALGVNDAKADFVDVDASLAAARGMVESCGSGRTTFAGIWPPEPTGQPFGAFFDTDAVDLLDTGLAEMTARTGAGYFTAPGDLSGHTTDGVHFTPDVSARYLALLAGDAELASR
ncbi:MAG: hypothetical protein WBA68_03595 [Alteraurantiacibacter sp.]